jgi:hypothetical protein
MNDCIVKCEPLDYIVNDSIVKCERLEYIVNNSIVKCERLDYIVKDWHTLQYNRSLYSNRSHFTIQ